MFFNFLCQIPFPGAKQKHHLPTTTVIASAAIRSPLPPPFMGEGDRFSGGGGVVKENTVLLSYATPPVSEADSPLCEGAKKRSRSTSFPLACHCEPVRAWQPVLFPAPAGAGRCCAPRGCGLPRAYALAMTVVVGSWCFFLTLRHRKVKKPGPPKGARWGLWGLTCSDSGTG